MNTSRLIQLSALITLVISIGVAEDDPAGTEATDRASATSLATEHRATAADGLASFEVSEQVDYRLQLRSGRAIDVGDIFRAYGATFTASLSTQMRAAKSPLVRINHAQSSQPLLLATRRGKVLHGPFASFSEDGSPVAMISYSRGERDSALLTWDDAHRPLVFAQYQSGKLHGIRCLFQSCGEQCLSGHIWLVQEWDRGELTAAHLVDDDGKPQSFDYRGGVRYTAASAELDEAMSSLASVDERIQGDEARLKQLVAMHYQRQRQAEYDRIRFQQAQMSYRFMAAMPRSVPSRRSRVVM